MTPGHNFLTPALALAIIAGATMQTPTSGQETAGSRVSYHRDVMPILKARCAGCHRPAKRKGKLDLSTYDALIQGGETGPAFLAGDPDKSLIVEMIRGAEPDMPAKGKPLTPPQIATIEQWIREGGKQDSPPDAPVKLTAPASYRSAPPIPAIAFSPDGKTLASCDGDYHMIQLWDISSGMVREQIKAPDQECAVHYSKSGRLLVAWHERNEHLRGFPAQDILAAPEKWDVLDHASPFSIAAAAHVSFMNDSKTVLGLWETDSRQLINRFAVATDNGSVSSVAISPDRKRLAVAYRFGKLHVWWLDDEQSDSRAGVPKSTGPKP